MREVQNKWNTLKLNDDIWAKLIYFERNRRLAKAYVSTPVLTLDGSTNGLDGFRIGLSGIENSYRDLDSMACLCSIGAGIKLKIDSQGNILIKRLAPPVGQQQQQEEEQAKGQPLAHQRSCSIWVKEWPIATGAGSRHSRPSARHSPATSTSSSSYSSTFGAHSSSGASDYSRLSSGSGAGGEPPNWPMYELLDSRSSYKLFDMQKFRAQLELGQREATIDWRQCVSIISFVRSVNTSRGAKANGRANAASDAPPGGGPSSQQQVLSDPCWLMLINIIAIDMLKSSVCDTTGASGRPSPGAQTSALINRYQHDEQARHAARLASRGSKPGAARPASSSRLLASAASAPQVAVQTARRAGGNLRINRSQQQQASLSSSSTRALATGQSAQGTSASTASSSSSSSARLLADQQNQRMYRSNGQLTDGSIYTTFTGKYLDKQQRMRMNAAGGRPRGAPPAAPLHQGSSFDDLRPSRWAGGRGARRAPLAHLDHSARHLLYPVDRFAVLQRREPALGSCDRYGRFSVLATAGGGGGGLPRNAIERPAANAPGRQLSHSLSAFDLSHGLKLNLRSMNSTSIRMNFDSDSETSSPEGGAAAADDDDEGYEQARGTTHIEDLVRKLKLRGRSSVEGATTRRAAGDETTSEWSSLAKKFSMLNFKPIEGGATGGAGQRLEALGEQKAAHAKDEAERASQRGAAAEQPAKRPGEELQQNASRASIVSTSSSSGCADNDYLVSQSSHSSMSSSTRSNEAELELFSQPASSSGINCGSGNTSDEYERQAALRRASPPGASEPPPPQRATASEKAETKRRASERDTQEEKDRPTLVTIRNPSKATATAAARDKGAAKSATRNKKNISLNRCYNVKTIDFSDNELESQGCGAGRCQEYRGAAAAARSPRPPGGDHAEQLQPCDCGEPECDQFVVVATGGASCDCCCDCLYLDDGGRQQGPESSLPPCCAATKEPLASGHGRALAEERGSSARRPGQRVTSPGDTCRAGFTGKPLKRAVNSTALCPACLVSGF